MIDNENIIDALELTRDNMRDYGIYVASGRAYPSIKDGLKSSYKRAIYGMHLHNKHEIVKVAELAAFALPYHPHPTSVAPVIISLGDNGNKLKLLDTQGNFGDSSKGVVASAERYIGGCLSELAEKLLCNSVEYSNFVKGEIDKDEPEALPALIPICFVNGLQGIPSGLPTLNIPTLNIDDIFDYYIDILKHKDLNYVPKKLPNPNIELDVLSSIEQWQDVLKTGKGSIRVAPKMSIDENDIITITALPGNKNVETVQKILEKEFLQDKIDIRDESTNSTQIVIERVFRKQCDMQEIYKRLYTKLQSNENYNMAFFDSEKIYVPCSFDSVVKANLSYVINTHQNRIDNQLVDLQLKLKVLTIIQDLKNTSMIKTLSDFTYEQAVNFICEKYFVERDIASKVFQKPLSYLTKEHNDEIVELKNAINELNTDKNDIYEFLLKLYREMKKLVDKEIKDKFSPTNFNINF